MRKEKSATLCYSCKANWLRVYTKPSSNNQGDIIHKECIRPWWQFWQWYCGARYVVSGDGNSVWIR